MSSPTDQQIKQYMSNNFEDCIEYGGVNITQLAENAAAHFNDYDMDSVEAYGISERYFEIALQFGSLASSVLALYKRRGV